MNTLDLLERLRGLGATLTVEGGRLKLSAPPDAITPELREHIGAAKEELLRLLGATASDEGPPLTPVPRGERTPLSPGQTRVWSMVARSPESGRYTLPLAFRLRGPLDPTSLAAAVSDIVARHEVLRSRVLEDERGPWTEFADPSDVVAFTQETVRGDLGEKALGARVLEEVRRPIDLRRGTPLRVQVMSLAPEDHALVLVMHHFVSDGWSFEVFFDELEELYAARLSGRSVALPDLTIQYADVVAWQDARLTPERRERAEAFWRTAYEGHPRALAFPPAAGRGTPTRATVPIPDAITQGLTRVAGSEGVTPFAFALTAYAVFLAAVTGQSDVVLCTPAAGREHPHLVGLIGYLNNVLPLRIRIDRDAAFGEMVRRVRDLVSAAHAHQELPFQDIASLPETSRLPLTRGMFAYHGQPLRSLRLEGIAVESIPVDAGAADFDVALTVEGTESGLEAAAVARPGVLAGLSAQALVESWVELLGRAITDPHPPVSELMDGVKPRVRGGPAPSRSSQGTGADESALPRDPLELQLVVIWERTLDVRPISVTDDFFDLGGHSLLAVRLMEVVEREVGPRLPLSVLLDRPTVRGMAAAIRSGGWEPTGATLLPMRTDGVGTPVMVLHSFEGHVFLFNELARRLGESRPVYGIQASGLDGRESPHHSVEDMAGHYLAEIEGRFGDEPVALVAMCFGLSVGLEMARRRRDRGLDTALVLIDGAWEHLIEPDDLGPEAFALGARVRDRIKQVRERISWWWDGQRRLMFGSPYARREAAIRRRTIAAWYRYSPRPYDGPITLVRARGTADDPTKGWHIRAVQSLAQGGLHSVVVPGHHFNLLREPHVAAVTAEIEVAVERLAHNRE